MNFDIRHLLRSLRSDCKSDAGTQAPDELIDYSAIVTPLSRITRDGRAIHSNEEFGYAKFFQQLLHEFLGDNPGIEERDNCIAGLSILLCIYMRQTHALNPDWRPEEVFLDIASQDDIRTLESELRNVPAIFVDGEKVPDFAQLPMFHRPIPLTDAALSGFINRRIAPHFPIEVEPHEFEGVEFVDDIEPTIRKVNRNEIGPLESDPLNDFDEYYREFFDNEDRYVDNSGEDED